MDLYNKIRKFLFKCQLCEMIVSVEFSEEDEKDIQKVLDNETELECPCGSHCNVLLD